MPVAFAIRLERRLPERHQCLSILIGEGDRHEGFETALALLLPGEGEDQPLGRNDFAVDAAEPKVLAAFSGPKTVTPLAARK
jgi:hypothetical protein